MSELNQKDIKEIEEVYLKGLTFHFVQNMMDVIDLALEKGRVKNALKVA